MRFLIELFVFVLIFITMLYSDLKRAYSEPPSLKLAVTTWLATVTLLEDSSSRFYESISVEVLVTQGTWTANMPAAIITPQLVRYAEH
jgi:hypothetical protein